LTLFLVGNRGRYSHTWLSNRNGERRRIVSSHSLIFKDWSTDKGQSSALTLRDFVPRLELLTLFGDCLVISMGFSEKFENVWNQSFQFILQIMFGSIFNTYQWRSDFMLHHNRFRDFLCKIGIFWYCSYCSWDFWSCICETRGSAWPACVVNFALTVEQTGCCVAHIFVTSFSFNIKHDWHRHGGWV